MARLFGTDGIRGLAGTQLTCELAMNIGRAAATVLRKSTGHRPVFLIGKDTRISGDMLENALAAGLCSVGADVLLAGVIPTPAIAYLTNFYNVDAGVVISASHNPMEFNGIKIFNSKGYKLDDNLENEIERLVLDSPKEMKAYFGENIGRVRIAKNAVNDYVKHIKTVATADFSRLKILVDCANGAASVTAPIIFKELGIKADFIGCAPDGTNINKDCGSTNLGKLSEMVKSGRYDLGIAFDGDADRCLAVDEKGEEIDGDKIMAILATRMNKAGKLEKNTVVATVMSNLGFIRHMKKCGINVATTAVGDRHVLAEMRRSGYNLGGEQSGHIIISDYATTGDGQMTALALMNYFADESDKKVSDFNSCYAKYPQVLINIEANQNDKEKFKTDEYLEGYIESKQQRLMGAGRVLVRVSGTEPYIRVMVEGEDNDIINVVANDIRAEIIWRLGL
jgi:phosphoglucosamine mutase